MDRLPELLLRPEQPKRGYRLRCRFAIEAHPKPEWLDKVKFKVAEDFVKDMEKQGWEYDPNKVEPALRGFRLTGPYTFTPITGLPSKTEQFRFSARRDLDKVLRGDRMRLQDLSRYVADVPVLEENEKWEYELSAVFIREQILIEVPDNLAEERSSYAH